MVRELGPHAPGDAAIPPLPGADPTGGNEGLTFASVGDPHVTTGDGLKFDNQKVGTFVQAKSESGDFQLPSTQTDCALIPGMEELAGGMVNTAAGVKMNASGTQVGFDALTQQLSVAGEVVPLPEAGGAPIEVPGGGSVAVDADGVIQITSAAGDTVTLLNHGNYLDITGEIAASRPAGSVRGALGAFDTDTDTANDMIMRDGTVTTDIDSFLESWRVS